MSIDNLDIIKRLIAEKECGRVEFKETTGQLERGMETLCAFLNGEGGTVLFGVTDKGKIIGQDVSDKTKRDIADAIRRIEPFATVEVSYTEIPDTGKSVIALSAEEQRYMRPFSYKGRAYLRVESATSIMPQEIYNQYLIQRGGKYAWEAIANPDLKISDLDEHAVISAVRGGIRSGRLPEATIREDLPTILEKFSLLHDGKLNNASAVLFGHDFYYYPQCLLLCGAGIPGSAPRSGSDSGTARPAGGGAVRPGAEAAGPPRLPQGRKCQFLRCGGTGADLGAHL